MKNRVQCLTGLLVMFLSLNSLAQETINVMPYPKDITVGASKFRITASLSISLSGDKNDQSLEAATNRFFERLNARTLAYFKQQRVVLNEIVPNATCSIRVNEMEEPAIGLDESYRLSIDSGTVSLIAYNTIGALRGLETLLQLVNVDKDSYYLPEVRINDAPRFKWRGMMVDAARHFLSVPIIKKQIDAMAMAKMNVLHFHLTDDEGFRVESKLFPELHQLGSNDKFYTQTELKELVKYASDRGIIVVPEFDLPGHTRSWLAGHPEFASQPGKYKPGHRYIIDPNAPQGELMKAVSSAPTPTIDPTNEFFYKFIDKFFGEMTTIFPSRYLHIGADENNGAAWSSNPGIVQFMKDNGIKDAHELHSYFVKRLYALVTKNKRTMIGWQEAYSHDLPKDVIIQAWIVEGGFMKAVPPQEIVAKGNQVLISTGFYLDLFLPAHVHYLNPQLPKEVDKNILGGEAALWSELVDEYSFEERAWPRAAAIAERLWSPANTTDLEELYRRLYIFSDRLEEAGLNHRLNIRRSLSELANGQNIDVPFSVLETLAPLKGYRRLALSMMQPPDLTYETIPLINLVDFTEIDSEQEWLLRKEVNEFLKTGDQTAKSQIENKLKKWNEAALQLPAVLKAAPNLKSLNVFSSRIASATEIGLRALIKPLDENQKEEAIKQLKGMKQQTDVVEIRILDEIEALVTGKLTALPASYPRCSKYKLVDISQEDISSTMLSNRFRQELLKY